MKSLPHQFLVAGSMSPAAARSLVETATALRRAAERGADQPLLRGKNIALLCTDPTCKAGADFDAAATRLGARVSRLQPDPTLLDADGGSVRMLARLYDAVECDDLPNEVAQRLQHLIGVPVYNGLARPDHPLAQLLSSLPTPSGADDPLYLIQAALLQTVT